MQLFIVCKKRAAPLVEEKGRVGRVFESPEQKRGRPYKRRLRDRPRYKNSGGKGSATESCTFCGIRGKGTGQGLIN